VQKFRVAIQGESGSFSHEAAMRLFPGAEIVSCVLSADVFGALTDASVEAAVIPIENSLAGPVSEHYDLLLKHDVRVVKEILLRIRHNLIALPGTKIDAIERVFSHPVALAQCRRFLARHTGISAYAFYDTAGSVKQVMEQGDPRAAAIASEAAAACFGAEVIERDIEDNPENYTRFFTVLRSADVQPLSEANKISLAFALENRPGTLVAALTALSTIGTNLTKIESRPVHGHPWEYIFYADCQLLSAAEGRQAMDSLRPHCSMVRELGLYREADAN